MPGTAPMIWTLIYFSSPPNHRWAEFLVNPCREWDVQRPDPNICTHSAFTIMCSTWDGCLQVRQGAWASLTGPSPPAHVGITVKYHLICRAKQVWRAAKLQLQLQCWHRSFSSFTCYLLALRWWYWGNMALCLNWGHFCQGAVSLFWTLSCSSAYLITHYLASCSFPSPCGINNIMKVLFCGLVMMQQIFQISIYSSSSERSVGMCYPWGQGRYKFIHKQSCKEWFMIYMATQTNCNLKCIFSVSHSGPQRVSFKGF